MEDLGDFELVSHDDAVLTLEEMDEIREWLHPTDYKYHDFSDHGSLWVKGVPGAGKSVIAASIIQHLRTTEDFPVLFFFFRNIVAANFLPRALLQDWLAQLLPYSPKLQFTLRSCLDSSLAECSDNDLFDIFLDGISSVPRIYCVVDALDEMSTNNGPLLDNLNILAQHRPDSLKLLITSRPKQYLQSALRDSSIVRISLQQKLVDLDIKAYLHHSTQNRPRPAGYARNKADTSRCVEGTHFRRQIPMRSRRNS
ncbi:ankyrin-3 [Podospora fimiseda]|uniref:Ankyrin-3 n=1 Tax=Podospora fimiseda TaxID=252190 RepID=A0AAN6YMN3_9PEZI|nr:ankyrin-3 [Podospora fimiseda]